MDGRMRIAALRVLLASSTFLTSLWSVAAQTSVHSISSINPSTISDDWPTRIDFLGPGFPRIGDLAGIAADCSTFPGPWTELTVGGLVGAGYATFTVTAVGTYQLCFRAPPNVDSVAQSGITVTVTSATSATRITAISPTSATVGVLTTYVFTGYLAGDLVALAAAGNCASVAPSYSISSGTASMTVSAGGAHDLCLRKADGTDSIVQTSTGVSVMAFTATGTGEITAIIPTTITQSRASVITFMGTAGKATFVATGTDCSTVLPSTDTATGSFTLSTAGTYDLCFRNSGGSDSIKQSGISLTVSPTTTATAIRAINPPSISVSWTSTIAFSYATTGDKVAFVITGSACPSSGTDISSGSASFTIGTQGTYDICFQASGNTWVRQTGVTLIVQPDTSTTRVSSLSLDRITVGVATSIVLVGAATGDKASFVISGTGCGGITPSTLLTAGTATFTLSTIGVYDLCVRMVGGTDSFQQTAITLNVVGVGFGSDPVAWHGGIKRVFNLPPGELVPLLETPDMRLSGSTFIGNGPWEQWFGRMLLTSHDKTRWMEVLIRRDLEQFNRSTSHPNKFESLQVRFGGLSQHHTEFITEVRELDMRIPYTFFGADVMFRRVKRTHHTQFPMIGKAQRECVDIAGEYLHFYICSAAAWEYHGWQSHLAVKFAHLDLVVQEVHSSEEVTGMLPELWGLKPMSEDTSVYINVTASSAEPIVEKNVSAAGLCKGVAWAGGDGYEHMLEKACMDTGPKVLTV